MNNTTIKTTAGETLVNSTLNPAETASKPVIEITTTIHTTKRLSPVEIFVIRVPDGYTRSVALELCKALSEKLGCTITSLSELPGPAILITPTNRWSWTGEDVIASGPFEKADLAIAIPKVAKKFRKRC